VPVSTLTSKGQITMPQSVRTALGLQAGDKVDFVPVDGGFKLVALRSDVHALRGRFAGRVGRPVSIDAMNEAVVDEAARRAVRVKKGGR
jgi:AbrB family looped-hinge helix DNA binding protein